MYRIIYEKGPDDVLRGTILCKDEENGHQNLFSVESLNLRSQSLLVSSMDHIIPNGPTKASILAKNGFSIIFDLFEVIFEDVTIDYPRRHNMFSAPLSKNLLSQDGTRFLTVLYAIFEDAVEAHVKVTLTNNSGPFYLYGVIAARTSAIDERAFSNLVFLKGHDEKIKVGKGDDIVIPFCRQIVAVPFRSQLILEFSLHISDNNNALEDGNDMMVERIVSFDAKRDGTSTASITCRKSVVKVEVKW